MNVRLLKDKLFDLIPVSVVNQIDKLYEWRLYRGYTCDNFIEDKTFKVVFMVDGKVNHGGLSDRLRGAVCTYYCCKKLEIPFRIYFNYPFSLQEYLVPNVYNWSIKSEEISYNQNLSEPVFLRMPNKNKADKIIETLYSRLQGKSKKTKHVYTNIDGITDNAFALLFKELFKPSKKLQELIDAEESKIGSTYVSATFRFQQLLGDFKEDGYKEYCESEKRELIDECIDEIKRIYKTEKKTVLVTSDSNRFLKKVTELGYVYVIPGEVVHVQYTTDNTFSLHAKSFLDLFLLSNSEKLYSIVKKDMYCSGFPLFASRINNKPFEIVK